MLCVLKAGKGVQATHIFDGLETWPTHLLYVASGRLQVFSAASDIPEMQDPGLLWLVEKCAPPLHLFSLALHQQRSGSF